MSKFLMSGEGLPPSSGRENPSGGVRIDPSQNELQWGVNAFTRKWGTH